MKAIWIDLDNSPHVPLFALIIKHYRKRGVEVIVTARDHAQTIELLKLNSVDDFAVVGRHYGKSKLNKIRGLFVRFVQLAQHIKRNKDSIAVAISHGSRSMVLAARWLKIPVMTMYDYEFTETAIFNRFSDRVLVPERIPDNVLDEIGLLASKRAKYQGIKEELYVRNFVPTGDFRRKFCEEHGARNHADRVLVVLRPPATTANYHSAKSEALLNAILRRLLASPEIFTVIMPRTLDQASEIQMLIAGIADTQGNYIVLEKAVDGLDLIYAADLVISGGGTMNREAALLGVPVYSIFAGKQGALDAQMERDGSITFIRDVSDIDKIKLHRRERAANFSNGLTGRVERFVIEQIDEFLDRSEQTEK